MMLSVITSWTILRIELIYTQEIANMEAMAVTFWLVGLHKILFLRLPLIVRRKRAKKGPEVEVEYVQTFIAVYCSLGCVP